MPTPGDIFLHSLRPTAIVGRTIARLTEYLSTSLGAEQINPAFHPTHAQAHEALRLLASDPQPVPRPLVIIGGYIDAIRIVGFVDSLLRPTVRDTPIIPVTIGVCHSFADARRRTIEIVEAALQQQNPTVDVVGLSLGGIVAVDARANCSGVLPDRRLNVQRLFAIGSPFTGVQLADFIPLTPYLRSMRPDSPFIERIAASSATMDVVAYGHRFDDVVGIEHCAPSGRTVNWLADNSWFWAHIASLLDVRIVADIALRLHGKVPISSNPSV